MCNEKMCMTAEAGLAWLGGFLHTDPGIRLPFQVWKGTQLASEHALLDVPCAIASFYADAQSPRIPALAVAIGPNVFIYRNLRPYFKFTLPLDIVSETEKTIW